MMSGSANMRVDGAVSVTGGFESREVDELLRFSVEVLETLRGDDGIYCFDRTWEDPRLRGRSLRYSIMVLLGLTRFEQAGGNSGVDLSELHGLIHRERDSLSIGDLGLLLWADVRRGSELAASTLGDLVRHTNAPDALAGLEGMETAWVQLGAVEAMVGGLDAGAMFERSDTEMKARRSSSGLFVHHRGRGPRRLLPNFATQVYALLALAEAARHDLRSTSRSEAVQLAERLITLRRPDAAWPWLFHVERNVVVEPYELYSVHQDAMAPMALFALAEVTGDDRFAEAAVEGYEWCFGNNELGFNFYDVANRFAHRAIRRRGAADQINLWTNTTLSLVGASTRFDLGRASVNATCRPYHLGWILEAWSGRQHRHPGYVAS